VSFLGREDRYLEHELAQEAPGIFYQLAQATATWLARRLSPPPALAEALAEYRRTQDVYAAFLEEVLEAGPGHRVTTGDLYRAYSHWCADTGERADSRTVCFRKLEERGLVRATSHGVRYFVGYKIRQKVIAPVGRTG
jgi:putative DNA primase/helicase